MLPVIDNRSIEVFKLPLLKKSIKIKPYKASQEKILLSCLADANDREKWLINIKQIMMDNMIDTDIDLDSINTIDFLFLCFKLRTISKGQSFQYSFACNGSIINEEGEKPCNFVFNENDSIDSILHIKNKDVVSKVIEIDDNLSLEIAPPDMKYMEYLCTLPNDEYNKYEFDDVDNANEEERINLIKANFEIFCNKIGYCVRKVIITENKRPRTYTDFTVDELMENILMNLTLPKLKKLIDAKNEIISMGIKIAKKCPKCNKIFEKEDKSFFDYLT